MRVYITILVVLSAFLGISPAYAQDGLCITGKYKRSKHFMPSGWRYKGKEWRQETIKNDALIFDGTKLYTLDHRGRVSSFVIVGKYTGKTLRAPSQVDAEHIVSLEYAFSHGANCWTQERRKAFAHDPDNLIMVDKYSNRTKSNTSLWDGIPPNVSNCTWYLDKVYKIVDKYGIQISEQDKKARDYIYPICAKHAKWIKFKRARNWYWKQTGIKIE